MEQQQWLDQVEASLRRAGLPAEYVSRSRTELADHIAEGSATAGESVMLYQQPKHLAGDLVQAYRKGGLLRRLPPALLLVVAVLLSVVVPVIYLVTCENILEIIFDLSGDSGEQADSAVTIAIALFEAGKLVAPCLGIVLLTLLVYRIARPWFWTAAIFMLFSLMTAATQMSLELTSWEEGELSIIIGAEQLLSMEQLPQAMLVVAVGMWIVLQQRREQLTQMELLGS